MHAERDELVKRTFPQIRKLCEERGVTWIEVDLRWGITEEESQRGEVLPTCLAEIQRCRPYFIGLLGERYGWVPEAIPAELIAQEPWLAEHCTRSATELEILHGVLNDPSMADHAFFYFRDPVFSYSKSREEQPDFLEAPSPQEFKALGVAEAERRARDRKNKLEALKGLIRRSGLLLRENYPTPQALGELVLRDLSDVIERLYPADQAPDPLDREALDHEAFARSRARIYIGRQAYFDRLEEYAESGRPPLVIIGESGSGKSALLSNWALHYRETYTHQPLLMHFVGATSQSADWASMLRRVMGEFKRMFGIEVDISDQAALLRTAFAHSLNQVAARGGVVLIVDALNQLEDREGALDLTWLPAEIPPEINLIVSALPGRPLDELNRRGWPTLKVEPLKKEEREQLITDYLAQYGKHLSGPRVSRIAHANQTANALYLLALLDELRIFGIHEELDSRIDHYLAARTPGKLYQKILERYEEDYETERPGLVRDAMALLWTARRDYPRPSFLSCWARKIRSCRELTGRRCTSRPSSR
jgi:hypothetical protein